MDIDRESALDAVDNDRLDRLLLVVSLFNFFPGMDALRLLEGEIDVAFLGFALGAHDLDLVAGLELGLALVIEHFRQRQHAFRLGADIDNHVSAGELQNGALDDAIFADRLFRLGGERLECGGEILGGRGLVLSRRDWLRRGRFAERFAGVGRLILLGLVLLHRRLGFGGNSGGGV